MSSIYIKEPPTAGKVLMRTSLGDLDFELWSKEAPMACRNFVQLCMEGYYNNVSFHRIVKNFCVQGGDPTGTGDGGESVFGEPFKDEFHSRLRFVRRGLVAMANSGPNDNGSQFFITLGPCNDLNKKHTIFGKIAGDTIYNLVRLGDLQTGEDDRPINLPVIKSTKVLANPFDDIEPRITKKKKKSKKCEKDGRKVKAVKNFKLLSFGDEAEENELEDLNFDVSNSRSNKGKSCHDIGNDPKLSSQTLEEALEDNPGLDDKDEVHKDLASKVAQLEYIRSKLKRGSEAVATNKGGEGMSKNSKIKKIQTESRKVAKDILKSKKRKEEVEDAKANVEPAEVLEEKLAEDKSVYGQFRQQKKLFKKKAREDKVDKPTRESKILDMMEKFRNKLKKGKSLQEDREMDDNDDIEKVDNNEKWSSKDDWLVREIRTEDELRDAKDMNRDVTENRFDISDPRNPLNQRKRKKQSSNKRSKDYL